MKTFTIETILIEKLEDSEFLTAEQDEESEALQLFSERAKQMGFSQEEIKLGIAARTLEWRDYKLVLIDE